MGFLTSEMSSSLLNATDVCYLSKKKIDNDKILQIQGNGWYCQLWNFRREKNIQWS